MHKAHATESCSVGVTVSNAAHYVNFLLKHMNKGSRQYAPQVKKFQLHANSQFCRETALQLEEEGLLHLHCTP